MAYHLYVEPLPDAHADAAIVAHAVSSAWSGDGPKFDDYLMKPARAVEVEETAEESEARILRGFGVRDG